MVGFFKKTIFTLTINKIQKWRLETTKKNGVKPKNQMSRNIFKLNKMKKNIYTLVILFIALTYSCNNSQNKNFDHYGIFVDGKLGTIELKGYQFEGINDHFQGSDFSNTIALGLKNLNEPVQIWVYSKSKTDEFILLTDLKNSRGEYVCCFNCGSYNSNPKRVCKPIDLVEKPTKKEEYRLFEAKISAGIYCFMNKKDRIGYIFKID